MNEQSPIIITVYLGDFGDSVVFSEREITRLKGSEKKIIEFSVP